MDLQQDAVNQPADTTAPTESAPVENNETNSQPDEGTPVESNQPETKVSPSVPYDRFSEVNAEKQRLAEEVAWLRSQQAPAQSEEQPDLDPTVVPAVQRIANQMYEQRKTQEFLAKHQRELTEDPILDGTVLSLMNKERNAGRIFDHETVLSQAKEMLEKRIKPAVKEANQTGFEEGQGIAQKKEQTAGVGNTN